MDGTLLIHTIDGDTATLQAADGTSVAVPAAWLPAGAQAGHAVELRSERSTGAASLEFRLVEGVATPDKMDVGA